MACVWLATFLMFVLRYPSFNALEQEMRRRRRLESWVGERKPSADTMGRVLGTLDLASLREMLARLLVQSWQRKAIHGWPGQAMRVVALDGHELWASTARCCADCLVRRLKVGHKKVRQYYHRVVVAQWIGVTPAALLDVELVRPGEGEVVAARRLLARILIRFHRLIDVISADALYLEAPFCRAVLEAGKHFVVVMKQEARDLYQDAERLRALEPPRLVPDGPKTTQLWDLEGLTTFTYLKQPVRVVWAEEATKRTRYVAGHRVEAVENGTWVWVTDLPASQVSAETIARWGHQRWDLENRGFNELATSWGLDHCFIHEPNAIQAIVLTLFIAFLTTYLFFERNLKPAASRDLSRLALSFRFREDLVLLAGASVWPPPEPSG